MSEKMRKSYPTQFNVDRISSSRLLSAAIPFVPYHVA
jgi:hypothetical protein